MRPEPTDWRTLLTALEADLRTILAADLHAAGCAGLYLVQGSRVGISAAAGFWGMYSPLFGVTYRAEIDREPGPVAVVNDLLIAKDRPEQFGDVIPLTAAIVSHEFAHAFEHSRLCYHLADSDRLATAADKIGQYLTTPQTAVEAGRFDGGHTMQFARRCLHISHRMTALGWYCPLSASLPAGFVVPFSPWAMQATLVDECERLAGLPIRALDLIDPPEEFAECWNTDSAAAAA